MSYSRKEVNPNKDTKNEKKKLAGKAKEKKRVGEKHFREIIDKFSKVKVMIIGDFISDVYIYGKPFKLSREAPVLVVRHERETIVPGGAGNAANNLGSLGCKVYALGILGNDLWGNTIVKELTEKNVNVDGLVRSHIVNTTSKTRIMAGDDHTSKQQVIRIDRRNEEPLPARLRAKIHDSFTKVSKDMDAIIVSDYGYGVISPRIITDLTSLAQHKTVVVDSRYQLMRFRGVTAVTPNESEAERATRIRMVEDKDVKRAAGLLKKKLALKAVLITRGNRGMSLFEETAKISHIPIVGHDDITDVTGAGDTVATVFTLALAAGARFYDSACLANYAAGIVVMKSGTAVVTRNELLEAVKKNHA